MARWQLRADLRDVHVQPALGRQAAGVRVDHVVRGASLAAAAQQEHLRRLRGAARAPGPVSAPAGKDGRAVSGRASRGGARAGRRACVRPASPVPACCQPPYNSTCLGQPGTCSLCSVVRARLVWSNTLVGQQHTHHLCKPVAASLPRGPQPGRCRGRCATAARAPARRRPETSGSTARRRRRCAGRTACLRAARAAAIRRDRGSRPLAERTIGASQKNGFLALNQTLVSPGWSHRTVRRRRAGPPAGRRAGLGQQHDEAAEAVRVAVRQQAAGRARAEVAQRGLLARRRQAQARLPRRPPTHQHTPPPYPTGWRAAAGRAPVARAGRADAQHRSRPAPSSAMSRRPASGRHPRVGTRVSGGRRASGQAPARGVCALIRPAHCREAPGPGIERRAQV